MLLYACKAEFSFQGICAHGLRRTQVLGMHGQPDNRGAMIASLVVLLRGASRFSQSGSLADIITCKIYCEVVPAV